MSKDLTALMEAFDFRGKVASIEPFGSGHINDSFRVINSDEGEPDYFLQRINHYVFKDVVGMMNNIHTATEFLHKKYRQDGDFQVLRVVKTKGGALFKEHEDNYWRLYFFISGLQSIDTPDSSQMIYNGARGFGRFLADLDSFDSSVLTDTIPFFHHMPKRLKRFEEVVSEKSILTKEESVEVDFVRSVAEEMCLLQHLQDQGDLPTRVTHNDTKFNNILFDTNGEAKCVIDLDTVMPGLVHFDYGDGIRTAASRCAEDEVNLSKVDINPEAFDAFTSGYLRETRSILTSRERETLLEGALMMTFIMGLRFLTDHLEDNVYYKISYPGHNLVRARCQLELTRKMIERKDELVSIVDKHTQA